MENSYQQIANIVLEAVKDKWTASEREAWKEAFLKDTKENVTPPFLMQMTTVKMHPSFEKACQVAMVNPKDIMYSPMFKAGYFIVYSDHEYQYKPVRSNKEFMEYLKKL